MYTMSVTCIPPYTPLLYSKTVVCSGTSISLIFAPKHTDCGYSLEQPRQGGSNVYPQSIFLAKIRKISLFFFFNEIFIFFSYKKSLHNAWRSVRIFVFGVCIRLSILGCDSEYNC